MRVRSLVGVTLLVALALFSLGDVSRIGAPVVEAQDREAVFLYTECGSDIPEGQAPENVRCGWLAVPETRRSGNGRRVRLPVRILKSTSATPEPDPVVYLTGGPGSPAVSGAFQFWGRASLADFIQSKRDYIFFDQRGTGQSFPALHCPETANVLIDALKSGREGAYGHELQNQRLRDCHARLAAEGVDFAAYNSTASALDIADLMTELGYDEYNLFGTSYGTRLALEAMRETPERVRSVILDSVVPSQVDGDVEIFRNAERALNVLFDGCRRDAECAARYPNFEADAFENVRRANVTPLVVTVNDASGTPVEIKINGDYIVQGAFGALYNRTLFRLIPFANDQIKQGNLAIVQVIAQTLIDQNRNNADAMTRSVHCYEEIPFITPDELSDAIDGVPPEIVRSGLGIGGTRAELDAAQAFCDEWTGGETDPEGGETVRSDIPALLLGGEYDPITPPEWGALAAETLSNGFFFEFPSAGHGVLGHAFDCVMPMMAAFLDRPSQAPDASCIDEIPPVDFFVEGAAEPPAPAPAPTPFAPPIDGIIAPATGDGSTARGGGTAGIAAVAVLGGLASAVGLAQAIRPRVTRR